MFNKIWKVIVYVFSGQMSQDHLDMYIKSKNPKNEEERLAAIKDYCRRRGGY